ncbi:MAG TPA: hypothetical protein VFV39_12240 [Limnobacter sp.]|nr:hypothetical protein [Limnobacter sp.]
MVHKPGRVKKALGACLVLSAAWSGAVMAHAEHGSEGGVPTVITPLPATIELSVAKAAAYQFALSTNGQHQVLVFGEDEKRPFLRLQGQQVQADVHSVGWHRAQQPGGGAIPPVLKENPNMAPNWVSLGNSAAAGWYDPRLQQEDITSFYLKLNIDGRPKTIEVARKEAQEIQGFWRPEILEDSVPTGLSAMIPGLSGHAIMLMRTGSEADSFSVLDEQGQAFLKLDPQGVWLNQTHLWAKELGLFYASDASQTWVQLSPGNAITYQDPRLKKTPKNRKQVSTWLIPIASNHSDKPLKITGKLRWESLKN